MTPPKKVKRALDLFSGTGLVSSTLKGLGWEVMTLDFAPRAKPDIQDDILWWNHIVYPRDILTSSQPECLVQNIPKQKQKGKGILT